jgi:hypothetical protein
MKAEKKKKTKPKATIFYIKLILNILFCIQEIETKYKRKDVTQLSTKIHYIFFFTQVHFFPTSHTPIFLKSHVVNPIFHFMYIVTSCFQLVTDEALLF